MESSLQLHRSRISGWATLVILALGIIILSLGYWPGIMIDDGRWQYQQSVDNAYEDWHPPLMAWIWRQLMFVLPGPAPMLILQIALYWGGIGLAAYWAHRTGRPKLALAIVLTGWIPAPFALTGTITKDCLMAGGLVCAAGLLLVRRLMHHRYAYAAASLGVFGLIFFAAALRLNAVVACLPLFIAALPARLTRTRPKLAASAIGGALALLAIGPTINLLLDAEKTDVVLSLIIFDLGGTTERSGVNQFPDLGVAHPVAVNHRCYDPSEWDSYSTWAKTACPLGFERFQNAKDNDEFDPLSVWFRAVTSQPLAYAEHRLTHFNASSEFLVPRGPVFTAWSQSVPNPWGYHIQPNAALSFASAMADAAAKTPLGWPIFWISLALASWIAGALGRAAIESTALAASSFLYGISYLVLGVAVGMRYYFWTITASALAAVLIAAQVWQRDRNSKTAVIGVHAAIVAVPTALAILARVAL